MDADVEFVSFVDYNSFNDIGFDSSVIDIGAVSNFAFLTYESARNILTLNLLFVDIYHDIPLFKMFKSVKKFSYDRRTDQDILIKSIIYSTLSPQGISDNIIKLLSQFQDHFTQTAYIDNDEEID